VLSIHPGGIDTVMSNPNNEPSEALNASFRRVPLQRIGAPEEVVRRSRSSHAATRPVR